MRFLSLYSKLLTCFVLSLILLGALVTSHDAGLSVPDWPSSFGYNMYTYPISQWIDGIFYEHTHRLYASFIGMLTIGLVVLTFLYEKRKYVKVVSSLALIVVICQGVLGGLTVLYKLPDVISVSHGTLGQTFFLITLFVALACSNEWQNNTLKSFSFFKNRSSTTALICVILLYLQLLLGAFVRHSESGLAIPDFPTMGGMWVPTFDESMLQTINQFREDLALKQVTISQVIMHFFHRMGAIIILIAEFVLLFKIYKSQSSLVRKLSKYLITVVSVQILLGILTVVSVRNPWLTSLHVVTGALLLGVNFLILSQESAEF